MATGSGQAGPAPHSGRGAGAASGLGAIDAPLGWGVIGATSAVARLAVLPALAASPTARLVAVASQSGAPGSFDDFGAERAWGSYQPVLDDAEVEALYIPLPNSLHAEWTARGAAAGKHVLCEKPLATSQAQAQAMVAACRRAGVVVMEAYMTPFHPRSEALARLVASERLGPLRFASSAFTGVLSRADDHRWDPAMGGGALLDVGIYCLEPILSAAGRRPRAIAGSARRAGSGVDASFSGWLDLGEGMCGTLECSFEAPERQRLEVVGTDATVVVERAFTPGSDDRVLSVRYRDGREEQMETPGGDCYLKMVEHFADVVRGRATPLRPPLASVALAGVLDRLRQAAGMDSCPG